MIRILVRLLAAISALVLAVWAVASQFALRHKIPDACTIRDFQEYLFRRLDIHLDLSRLSSDAVRSGDVCLHLDILEGPESAPTVVFMPGTACYAQLYLVFLYALNDRGYNVVGFDPRGHGLSGGLRGEFTLSELVDDALNVVAYAQRRWPDAKVGFAGSSQGGMVGLYIAAVGEGPDSVMCHDFAVANGTTIFDITILRPPKFLRPLTIWLFGKLPFLVLPVTWYLPFNKLRLRDGTKAVDLLEKAPLATLAYSLRALSSLGYTPLARPLPEVEMPVMLLGSTKDEVFPPWYLEDIFEKLQCERVYVNKEGLPHLLLMQYVDDVIDDVDGWFDRTLR